MPIWIPIAVSAALFQCWRTAMQQKLRGLFVGQRRGIRAVSLWDAHGADHSPCRAVGYRRAIAQNQRAVPGLQRVGR